MLVGASSGAALGRQQSSEEYVPRSEYEQLKLDFAALQRQVNGTEHAAPDTYLGSVADESQERESDDFELFPGSDLTPGWERARAFDWMEPGRLGQMTVRIARAGSMDLYMGLDTVGRILWYDQDKVEDGGVAPGSLEPGFDTAFGNVSFLADFDRDVEVYFSFFIAGRPHPNYFQGDEGYMLIRQIPGDLGETDFARAIFDNVNIKAGEFELDFGDAHYRRSINAAVQRNPLIGNYIIDPRGTEIGVEVFSPKDRYPVNWLAGIASGGDTGDFRDGHGLSLHGKLWMDVVENLRASASVYWVDHSGNPASVSRANFFRANRSGGPYGGVLGGGSAPGQITPGAGQQVFASQFDLTWDLDPLELYGHLGFVQDADTNGSDPGTPREAWLYYAAEGVYRFTPRLYAAARYSGASATSLVSAADSSLDVDSDGMVHRFQVGLGYWVTETILLKVEYVYQSYDGFSMDGSQVSGVDVWRDPRFQGVAAEVSFAF